MCCSEWNTGELSDRELLAVETVERAANEASPFMVCVCVCVCVSEWVCILCYLDLSPHPLTLLQDTVHQKERGLFDTFVDAVDPVSACIIASYTSLNS